MNKLLLLLLAGIAIGCGYLLSNYCPFLSTWNSWTLALIIFGVLAIITAPVFERLTHHWHERDKHYASEVFVHVFTRMGPSRHISDPIAWCSQIQEVYKSMDWGIRMHEFKDHQYALTISFGNDFSIHGNFSACTASQGKYCVTEYTLKYKQDIILASYENASGTLVWNEEDPEFSYAI